MARVERLLRTPGGVLWAVLGVLLLAVTAITPVAALLWIAWAYLGLLGLLEDRRRDPRDTTTGAGCG